MIRNIIFDVGKVLVEFDWEKAFQELGFEGETFECVADATVRSKAWDELDRSSLSDKEQLLAFIENAPEYEKEIKLLWENIGRCIWQYDYAMDFVKTLKKNGYHTYILSNYGRYTRECTLEALSFEKEMDGVVFSYQIQAIKPEPEIYQELLTRYHLDPDECVFLDDRQVNLDEANRQGIHTILFQGYEQACEKLRALGVQI